VLFLQFQNLEEKMKAELKSLADKMDEMQKDIRKFQDIDAVKIEGNEKLRKLQSESASLDKATKSFGDTFKAVQIEHEKLKVHLHA
jgi:hypothetical protein